MGILCPIFFFFLLKEYYVQFSKVSMKLLYNCANCQVIKESIIINLVAFLMSYYSIRCLGLSLKETTRQMKFSLFSYCIYIARPPHNKRSDLQDKTHFLILGNHKVQLQMDSQKKKKKFNCKYSFSPL